MENKVEMGDFLVELNALAIALERALSKVRELKKKAVELDEVKP